MLNDTYTQADLEAAQRALDPIGAVVPGSRPLPVEVRVAEAIAKARDEMAARVAGPRLSEQDKTDLVVELDEHAGALLARYNASSVPASAVAYRQRAERVRQLITLLAVLLLSACAAAHGRIEGPPLYVHLCHEMPAADAEAWGEAAGALNRELEDAALFVGHGPPRGCDSVDVCPSDDVLADAETHVGTCVVTVRYAPGTAREVATQELDALLGRLR